MSKTIFAILSVLSLSLPASDISSPKSLIVQYSSSKNVAVCKVDGEFINILSNQSLYNQKVITYFPDDKIYYLGFIQGKSYYCLSENFKIRFNRLSLAKQEAYVLKSN